LGLVNPEEKLLADPANLDATTDGTCGCR